MVALVVVALLVVLAFLVVALVVEALLVELAALVVAPVVEALLVELGKEDQESACQEVPEAPQAREV